jgi:(S)-ureidoglycine aminohydrolase
MRQQNQLLSSRARVSTRFAVFPLEGYPLSRLPLWPDAQARVLAGPALGAGFVQYLIDLPEKAVGNRGGAAEAEVETFLYVISGEVALFIHKALHELKAGGYALIPPGTGYSVLAEKSAAQLLLLRKRYEPAEGIAPFAPLVGNEKNVAGAAFNNDPGALLQLLIPDEFQYDMAMNIFTFQPGHSLPYVETHIMEHGLYVLAGKGLYYLEDTWMEIEATDFIYMAPFCPQSYYATGPTPTKYLYYKNVNREIAL